MVIQSIQNNEILDVQPSTPVELREVIRSEEPSQGASKAGQRRLRTETQPLSQSKTFVSNLAAFRNVTINGEAMNGKKIDIITAKPGEIIFVAADVGLHLVGFGPRVLNQIIVGLEPTKGREPGMTEIGAQQCILHEVTEEVRPFRAEFTLRMPTRPGKYDIRFNNTMEYTPADALSHWSERSTWLLPPKEGTIATIIVE